MADALKAEVNQSASRLEKQRARLAASKVSIELRRKPGAGDGGDQYLEGSMVSLVR